MILSLDIATRTGIAVGKPGSVPVAWSEDLGKGRSEDARLSRMLALTSQLIEEHCPDLMAVEIPAIGERANLLLIGLAACARGVACNRGVVLLPCAANSVRKHFLGRALTARDFPALSRSKAKREIKNTVIRRCALLGWGDLDGDAADAAAQWDFACAKTKHPTKMPGGLFHAS